MPVEKELTIVPDMLGDVPIEGTIRLRLGDSPSKAPADDELQDTPDHGPDPTLPDAMVRKAVADAILSLSPHADGGNLGASAVIPIIDGGELFGVSWGVLQRSLTTGSPGGVGQNNHCVACDVTADEVRAMLRAAMADLLISLPSYPEDQKPIDVRDVIGVVNHGDLYGARLRDLPFNGGGTPDAPAQAPVINTSMGTRGTIYLPDEGARSDDRNATRNAMIVAAKKIKDGGRIFVPFGDWPMHDVTMPAHKDYIIEGETELGARLVGAPGRDILYWDDPNAQRRLQNRQIIRNLRFFMPGNGKRGNFNRETTLGWQAGAAALAWRMPASEGDQRKASWGSSYLTLENVTAHGEKDAVGACLLYSDRPLYGFRASNIFIGDHGTTVSGLHGGIVFGKPPVRLTEATPDEFRVNTMVHWGGQCSIAAYGVANAEIFDHKAYSCRYPLHLTGYEDKGHRKRCRDLYISSAYYDNDVLNSRPGDAPMVAIDTDGLVFGVIHLKGSRDGEARPVVSLSGQDVEGGQFRLMGSGRHRDVRFAINGSGHDFKIRAGGMDSKERATLINGKASYPGVVVA